MSQETTHERAAGRVWHGKAAVRKVRERWPDQWHPLMSYVVLEEGYTDGVYYDTKGIPTYGVGQTASLAHLEFPEVFNRKLQQIKHHIPNYTKLPGKVQGALLSAHYRGDWLSSPLTRKLFDQGLYREAAEEFLDNDDYRRSVLDGTGVAKRFERVAKAISSLG